MADSAKTEPNAKAPLFSAVELANILGTQTGIQDRRTSRRYPYPAIEAIAPYKGPNLPSRRSFRKVACRDLSGSGIAFFWPTKPDFQHLVVALGNPPIYLTARVVRYDPSVDPSRGIMVACRFLGRVRIPA
jgi:hypothetical protein